MGVTSKTFYFKDFQLKLHIISGGVTPTFVDKLRNMVFS
nr:MAG TPA: hypothetical protein [Caudoviricetes sp.]